MTKELQYWIPKFEAADVNRKNFRSKTKLVLARDTNSLLWKLRVQYGLIYWVNPDGLNSGRMPIYWYPRDTVIRLLEEIEQEGTLHNYRFVNNGIIELEAQAQLEFERAKLAAFSPKH